ncbi:hypothetical protein Tco_0749878 [Tanacetum coccineum]|uniref:Uncharacterized protein n=1 Tax=Tanacetum coccineum TaxID=301880 RepID=A0ABQ4Z2R7_9ASTR
MTPRSCLRWKPTGKIFKIVGLRWVPTGKIFASSTTKVDSEPTKGSNEDITNQYECKQTLDVSAGTPNLSAGMTSNHNSSKLRIHDHNNELSSSKLVPKVVPSADTTAPSKQELDLLFGPLYDEFFTAGTSCVNKSSSPTDNSKQQDTPPSATAQSTTELITPTTTIIAEDNILQLGTPKRPKESVRFSALILRQFILLINGDTVVIAPYLRSILTVYSREIVSSFQDDAKSMSMLSDQDRNGGKDRIKNKGSKI